MRSPVQRTAIATHTRKHRLAAFGRADPDAADIAGIDLIALVFQLWLEAKLRRPAITRFDATAF